MIMPLITIANPPGRDVIHELDHSMPAAFHAQLGALLKTIVAQVNANTTAINALVASVNGICVALDAVPVAGNFVATHGGLTGV